MPRSDENIPDEKLYEIGMKTLRKHSEEYCRRVMKSRNEDKGNFTYLEDENFKRETEVARTLQLFLSRTRMKLDGKEKNEGPCGIICSQCPYIRFNFNHETVPDHWCNESSEGWYCQEECECK